MLLQRTFPRTKFPSSVVESAIQLGLELADEAQVSVSRLRVERGDEDWYLDSIHEWYAEYDRGCDSAEIYVDIGTNTRLTFRYASRWDESRIGYTAPTRGEVERLMQVFTSCAGQHRIPDPPKPATPPEPPVVVFIGHGHSADWRAIKDHLHDKQGYAVEAYEVGARAGLSISAVLDKMASKSSFAVLVLTAEDFMETGLARPRQNVVHELGLFQGHLGFPRAIAVVEEGVEVLSNLAGVDQIRYPTGQIGTTFGDILATLRREFGDRR